MLITTYKIGGVQFRLFGTNGFRVKAKNERFTAASSRCRQNLKYENFTSSFGRLRQNQKAYRTCSTIIFLHSTNEIIDLWRCRWRCRRQIFNSLISRLYHWLLFCISVDTKFCECLDFFSDLWSSDASCWRTKRWVWQQVRLLCSLPSFPLPPIFFPTELWSHWRRELVSCGF